MKDRYCLLSFVLMLTVLFVIFVGCGTDGADRESRLSGESDPAAEGLITPPTPPAATDAAVDDPPVVPVVPEEPPPDPTLILALSFDDHVLDHSQHGNDGAKWNAAYVNGKFGKALAFDGANSEVVVSDDPTLSVHDDVTVMAWIYQHRFGGPNGAPWQAIVTKGNNPRSYSFYTVNDAALHLSVGEFKGSNSAKQLSLDQWQHVVAQVDDGVHRYWLNGRSVGAAVVPEQLPGRRDTAAVRIGNSHEPSRNFSGRIDEVRIWNRALSEVEINEQMHKGSP